MLDGVLGEFGVRLEAVLESEVDAALGNGGLGRLAACFLDSLATLGLPGYGYGINYEYGLFRQEIPNGYQLEKPDSWQTYGTPWQIERPEEAIVLPALRPGRECTRRTATTTPEWLDWKVVVGVPHDMPIVGYGGHTVNYLRLFPARASEDFDMSIFNQGDYIHAGRAEDRHRRTSPGALSQRLGNEPAGSCGWCRSISWWPARSATSFGDYLQEHNDFEAFADKVAIQLNDTHPALAVAELMRVLIDEHDLDWDKAWEITPARCAYTNHTLMPEALEKWPVALIEKRAAAAPADHLRDQSPLPAGGRPTLTPDDDEPMRRMSMIEEGDAKQVRMAHLAIVGSHSVNGVAALHSELVKTAGAGLCAAVARRSSTTRPTASRSGAGSLHGQPRPVAS